MCETAQCAEVAEQAKPTDTVETADKVNLEMVEITISPKPIEIFESCETIDQAIKAETVEPACKRVRLPESLDCFINIIVNSMEPLKAILDEDCFKPVIFTKVYVGQIKNIRDTSEVISILNKKLPLKELSHLKRACRKEVILFPATNVNSHTHEAFKQYLEENCKELKDAFDYYRLAEVPARAPKTRKQQIESVKAWSCNFHPDKHLEMLLSGDIFSEVEIKYHRTFMGMAFEVARYYLSKSKPDLESSDVLLADLNATVVVDPDKQSVVAVAFDNRQNNPTQHSAMIAIDNVAKTQNGGVWFDNTDIPIRKLQGIGNMELLMHLKDKYPSAKFGAKYYITRNELMESEMDASDCPYLCTGYHVYMIREPCLMCAMGLLHARSKRVFFCSKYNMGALNSKTKLQCVPSLNHRFEVFTDFL